jgi:magnesium transporter
MGAKSRKRKARRIAWTPHHAPIYAPPGSITVDPAAPKPVIRVIAYGPDQFIDQPIRKPEQIRDFLHTYPVTWVNVDGLGDAEVIKQLGEIFTLHRLALEDVAHVRQRAKVDEFNDHLFIVARMIDRSADRIGTEQLSMFLGKNFVLTFQERAGDCLDAIRQRAKDKRGRVRDAGPDYLAYSILDAVVDEYFPILEADGDRLEQLEDSVLTDPGPMVAAQVHQIKRELLVLRRGIWPLREAIGALQRGASSLITAETRLYLRDCHDHTFQVLDLVEVYRELSSGLIEMYMTSVSYRMNEIMKVLTIIATIFIPLTFVVGIYGMNFDPETSIWSMPELRSRYGYPIVMAVMALIAGGMLLYFWRKGWLRSQNKVNGQEHNGTRASGDRDAGAPHAG